MKPEPGNRFKFILPVYGVIPRKTKKDKKVPINLNWYRNAQHFESNRVKQDFTPIYAEWWEGQAGRIRITYQIQKMTRARFDTMNFVTIVDKFFCDLLVSKGLIKDDDFSRVEIGGATGKNQCKKNRCYAIVEILENDGLQIKP